MSNKLQELEQALTNEKARLKTLDLTLQKTKDELQGRAFVTSDTRGSKNRSITVRYFLPDAHIDPHYGVMITERRVCVAQQSYCKGQSLIREQSPCRIGDHLTNVTFAFGNRVSQETFTEFWEGSAGLVRSFLRKAATRDPKYNIETFIPEDIKETAKTLDLPHIIATPPETRFLQKPFLIDDACYLITPQSLSLAEELMTNAQEPDARCSGLYEACDRAYVLTEREIIAKLRRKLSAAKAAAKL